jgi:hypothetical protein
MEPCRFIQQYRETVRAGQLCRVLEVSRSGIGADFRALPLAGVQ